MPEFPHSGEVGTKHQRRDIRMSLFSSFKEVRRTSNMLRAEREAEQKEAGLEPLMLILIEEVRQLRQNLADERDARADRR